MAKSLKIRVCDLLAEFLAHTFIFGGAFHAAGAISTGHFKALADGLNDFLVGVFFDFHDIYRPYLIFVRFFGIINVQKICKYTEGRKTMSVQKINAQKFEELMAGNKPVLLDFYADWCGPCRMLAPIVEEIAAEHPEIVVGKVNVDEEGALAQRFGIVSIPFVALLQNGRLVGKALGYRPKSALLAELGL